MWRGSLLPLGCAAAPTRSTRYVRQNAVAGFTTAAQPSGSKLPRHKSSSQQFCVSGRHKKGHLEGAPGPKPAVRMGRAWLRCYVIR
ncbi:hypothetical protein FQ192_22870 [Pseudomonas sp. ANT_J12]|nr:hypothetical protein FQ192_22870 [Pseudomonas sp. ANT_J12]